MSSISKVSIATLCKKPGNDDSAVGYGRGYARASCIEGDHHNGDGDSRFVPVAFMEGDDDDDGYDYAPAA